MASASFIVIGPPPPPWVACPERNPGIAPCEDPLEPPIRSVADPKDLPSMAESNDLTPDQQKAIAELLRRDAPVADELGHRFAAAGHELALVGGPVRDALLGRPGNDLDFTTDASPERILEI